MFVSLNHFILIEFQINIFFIIFNFQKHQEKKEEIQKLVADFLPQIKITSWNSYNDIISFFRILSTRKSSVLIQRDMRPYILAENINFIKNESVL